MTKNFLRRVLTIGLGIVMLALVGCTVKVEVTFYGDEAWEAVQRVNFAPGEMFGGEASTDMQIEQTVNEWRAMGIDVEWHKDHPGDGSTTYVIEEKGQGYDLLLATVFNEGVTLYEDAEGQIHFEWYGSSGLVTQEVQLTGGRIISSDADAVQGNTAIWYNPESIEAVLTPASRSVLGSVPLLGVVLAILLLAALAGVVVVVVLLARRKQAQPIPVHSPAPAPVTPAVPHRCIYCGGEIRSQARFCSHCGKPQT